ncbi:uncharacterized protein cubi_02011 [Cryptosporidium ubiquitum]|uniref:Uncharacterized protein n=1 Tax=Cryptosporidium ubiquitum TaxID=857276 RepID=A0A1J4MMK7_9CRYT|nr:uncharacterized protein cubi_02011 [Cryptosporidium ubiquitum]OII75490.1 hypothetical protein cubi_02011 [Cryptosporidium ubiquitum]
MSIGYSNNNNIVDKTLEAELNNPRILAWSVIIKDGQPIHNNNALKVDNNLTSFPNDSTRTSFEFRSPSPKSSSLNSPSFFSRRNTTEKSKNKEIGLEKNKQEFKDEFLRKINEENVTNNEPNFNVVKRDFSIWRCLYWPEIAINPVYSGGYGKMRLALCLNKILTSAQERNQNHVIMGRTSYEKRECINLLPYIRILYDNELLFQSCIVNKNICVILEIEVHHPLSRIIIEIFDFDDSDPSLISSSDNLIGHIIIPVGAHSNRKPLENRLIVASDDDGRILFIRKTHQKKVHNENLMAQKLLRFPIKSCERLSKTRKSRLELSESPNIFSEFIDEEETLRDTLIRNSSKESLDGCIINELPNIIYFELANQMVKDAIDLSHSAEIKYKSIGILQEPHCSFVVQVFSEIKWSRLSIIPREIFALYLPEPKVSSKYKYNNKNSNYNFHHTSLKDNNLEINIKIIINSMILLKEIYYSECIYPYKVYIWKLFNWELQLHSLFALSIIWYLLFHPKYIFSLGFLFGLIILFMNFHRNNLILNLERSISRNLKTLNSVDYGTDELEDNILCSPIKSNNHAKSLPLNNNSIPLENLEESKSIENIDFTILENLLTSICSPNTIKYIQKFSYIFEKSAILIYGIIKLHFWGNFFQSILLAFAYSIFFLISLLYSNEFSKYMRYFFLTAVLLPSTYFLPPIKGFLRIIKSYKKFKKLKKNR